MYKTNKKTIFLAKLSTLLLTFLFLSAPLSTHALTVNDLVSKVSSIQSMIDSLRSEISGLSKSTSTLIQNALSSPVASSGAYNCTLLAMRNLQMNDAGENVRMLQKILNISTDTQITSSGAGSPGNETTSFGPLTYKAVIRFQNKYADDVLAPAGLTSGTGFGGSLTRAKMGDICDVLTSGVTSEDFSAAAANGFKKTFYKNLKSYKAPQSGSSSSSTTNTTTTTTTNTNSQTTNTGSTTIPPKATTTPVVPTPKPKPPVVVVPEVQLPTVPVLSNGSLKWGAYVGEGTSNLSTFESLVGKQANMVAVFTGWSDSFPSQYSSTIGAKGKTLVIFWEPNFGYDSIIDGSKDAYITQFAKDAKAYGYPVILAPFAEMNLEQEDWGFRMNNNTASKFVVAWKRMYSLFGGASNVKFALDYNQEPVPDVSGNKFADYYPGDAYVDYIGVDGFNFGSPWLSFKQLFDSALVTLAKYNKPIYLLSMGSASGSQKAQWITDALGTQIKNYPSIAGWIWFNVSKEVDWRVNSDSTALQAFKGVLP